MEKLSLRQIARLHGLPVGTVMSRHARGVRGDALVAPAVSLSERGRRGGKSNSANPNHPWRKRPYKMGRREQE